MIVKEMIEYLKKQDLDREVVLWDWNAKKSEGRFLSLMPSVTPLAHSKNLLTFIDNGVIEKIQVEK